MDPHLIKREVGTRSRDAEGLEASILERLVYSVGKDRNAATHQDWYQAIAQAVRDRIVDHWIDTTHEIYRSDQKRVYYLSLEFLIGRLLSNNLINLGLDRVLTGALESLGKADEDVIGIEPDAALGNGGLGRLAACFLDSMATLGLPGYGYGIRYRFGLFEQRIEKGWQVEYPENWLKYGNPWEFPRPEVAYPIQFYGHVESVRRPDGSRAYRWVEGDQVMAMAFDTPVVGFGGVTINTLRLWTARATSDLNFDLFNAGDYLRSVERKINSENLSRVLYPNDETLVGRELRLKQEYFFTSASLQDILRRFMQHHGDLDRLPDKVAIQLNDTHPAIGIAEMMRLLVDQHEIDWDRAWSLTQRTFSYTNHTLLPEALEAWPVGLIERVLPRHMQIIYDINGRFLHHSHAYRVGDQGRVARLSLIDEQGERRVRMGNLAFLGSHKVNGVSALHTDLMKRTVFADLHAEFPDRIINKTNGITPRRWLLQANPDLADLITRRLDGSEWVTDLDRLAGLRGAIDDPDFREEFRRVKRRNKARLADQIRHLTGVDIAIDSMFDIHIKRFHEYKRQLLNILHAVSLYNDIRANQTKPWIPVTKVFAGKAYPNYRVAKLIIKLINDVAEVVNNDPAVCDLLKIVFLPNYNVTLAEAIIPAADLSEQISTAGLEASGTGNMKLALNGALTIGTLDGANVEIRNAVGPDNIFIFGLTAEEAGALRSGQERYDPHQIVATNRDLKLALEMVASGVFSRDEPDRYRPLLRALFEAGDRFLVLADFASYARTHDAATSLFRDRELWARKAIVNTASVGWFSSDRTVAEYAREIWGVEPITGRR